jgi:hypothetical protein
MHSKTKIGGRTKAVWVDRNKIDMSQVDDVRHWTRHLRVTREDLQKAVDKVGNSASAVKKQLGIAGEGDPV